VKDGNGILLCVIHRHCYNYTGVYEPGSKETPQMGETVSEVGERWYCVSSLRHLP
jgi:hypothetical protein